MRDKSILECSEKMCEYCCNFDKEHIGMDGTALCKLTMTLAYAEDYGGNCMFYNVPKEQIIVPPCKVGDIVYAEGWWWRDGDDVATYKITNIAISQNKKGEWTKKYRAMRFVNGKTIDYPLDFSFEEIGKTVFLTRGEAEKALRERSETE